MVVKGFKIHDTTNLVAEARAIREGLTFYKDNQINKVILESDSLALVQMINREWKIPWCITMELRCILEIIETISVRVRHSLSEGNTLVIFVFC